MAIVMRGARDIERLIDAEYCVQLCDSDTCCAMVEGDPVAVVEIITDARLDVVAELRRLAAKQTELAAVGIIGVCAIADHLEALVKAADADKEET